MLVPYDKLKDNIKPLALLMVPDITVEKVYNTVIEYATKAADEYNSGEMRLDENSAFVRVKKNTEALFEEVNATLGIDMLINTHSSYDFYRQIDHIATLYRRYVS